MAYNLAAQVLPTMLEQVNPKLPYFLTQEMSEFAQMFQGKNEKHNVSNWSAGTVGSGGVQAYRIPVLLAPGGDMQVLNLNGGDMGTGSAQETAFMTLGAFPTNVGYNLTSLAMMATDGNEKAIKDALKMAVGRAIKEQALYGEIDLFQGGDGVLAIATNVSTTTGTAGTSIVYTLSTDVSYVRLRGGTNQLVDITDSGGVIRSTGGRVTNIDYANNQITVLIGTTFTASATDQIVVPNIGPVTSTTVAVGSYRYGIYTFNTTTTSGSLLGLAYSTAYELACPKWDAGQSNFSPLNVYSGKNQLIQRRDPSQMNGLVGVCHQAQRTAWYLDGLNIATQFVPNGEAAKSIDTAGQGTDRDSMFEAGDIKHYVSKYATKNRVDWLNPSNFGRVRYADPGFFTSPEGQRMFQSRSASTGNIQAATQFYAISTENMYSVDPGCSMINYNLSIPAGS